MHFIPFLTRAAYLTVSPPPAIACVLPRALVKPAIVVEFAASSLLSPVTKPFVVALSTREASEAMNTS